MSIAVLQSIFYYILVAGIIFTCVGTIGHGYFSKKVDQKKEQESSSQIKKVTEQNNELIAGKNELLIQNKDLSKKIGIYQKDLQEKDQKIEELDKKAKMSARNVTSMYDFNGAKRQTSGGKITLDVGEEYEVFQQMTEFVKAKDLPNLIKLCEKQIEKTPDWYTPYFYLGAAQADMGLKDKAIKNIRYVVDNTPGDAEYAEARKILERLEQQP